MPCLLPTKHLYLPCFQGHGQGAGGASGDCAVCFADFYAGFGVALHRYGGGGRGGTAPLHGPFGPGVVQGAVGQHFAGEGSVGAVGDDQDFNAV